MHEQHHSRRRDCEGAVCLLELNISVSQRRVETIASVWLSLSDRWILDADFGGDK
jgi:ABC-type transport system involved in cytochrome c biogenesis ATPase subunit